MADTKDTIYVDIDDEITALIDKVRSSNGRVIALVLPKRASVLQSIVNMKLLKRTADNEKKNLVLITSEAGLLPLAGAVGIHVASSLNSKPEIPAAPAMGNAEPETVAEDLSLPIDDEEELPDLTKRISNTASVGSLAEAAKKSGSSGATKTDTGVETLQLEDEEEPEANEEEATAATVAPAVAAGAAKKNKKLKVPNFDRFRMLMLVGILVIIGLIVLAVFAFTVWPHATIDIKTDSSYVNTNQSLTLDTTIQSANLTSGDIPAKQVSEQKTFTQTVNTTGQKNEGTAATGQVNMTASDCNGTYAGNPFTIPAGTGLSANNLTYITQNDTQMVIHNFSFKTGCVNYTSSGSTSITAQSPGTNYNTQPNTTFTVSGYPGVTASGSASGGTDNIVQVVAQADINSATSKINSSNSGTAQQDLANQLKGQGLYPINATFTAGSPQISSSPNVGDQSNTVTVTETITYTMFGAHYSDIKSIVDSNIQSQTSKNQNIINDGINQSAFKQGSSNGTTDQVTLATLAEVGPNISTQQIKKEAAGKSPQAIISSIKSNPDVTNVTVRLSPFWVTSAPSSTSKIKVNIAKPTSTAH